MLKRILELFRGRRLDRELDEEVSFHLAQLEKEFRAKGMSDAAAAVAARREFGGVAHVKEAYREERGIAWIENILKDLIYAMRVLRLNPGFTAAAVLSLALGIGASTAIFSMFHALMLRMLPVSHPEELLTMYRTGGWGSGISSYPLYLEVRKRTDIFNGAIASTVAAKTQFQAGGADRPETAQREFVSGNYFQLLGVAPAAGRLFTDDDNRTPHAHPIVILSYEFWRNRFGGDPAVVGRTLIVNRVPVTVAGVAAAGFRGLNLERHPDLWEPAMMINGDLTEPGMNAFWIVARRRPQLTMRKAQAAIDVVLHEFLSAAYGSHPNAAFRKTAMNQHIEVRDGGIGISMLRQRFGKGLTILMAAVLLVLLAACLNVANLLLARGAAREREAALRLALGASRGRLLRQALTESLLLACAGGALGILLAYWSDRGILQFLPPTTGDPFAASPNWTVLGFCLAASLVSALLFGLAPALRTTALDPAAILQTSGTRAHGGRRPTLRRALVIAQVAFSVVLAVLAGLCGHSLAALRSIDLGFHNQEIVTFSLDLPGEWRAADRKAVRARLLSQLEAQPGVSSVSFGFPGPYLKGTSSVTVTVPGSPVASSNPAWVNIAEVAPHYFEMLGSVPVAGREFDRSDEAASDGRVLVNEAFVRKFLAGEGNPLARTLSFDSSKPPAHIVGVVRDIPHNGVRENPEPTVYRPAQMEGTWGSFLVRSRLPHATLAQAIRRETARLGPQAAVSDPRTIRQDVDDSIFQDRLLATLSGCFGGLTLLLAAIGLYGVVSYGTAQRAGEIGIRIALGAQRRSVLWMVLRGALLLVAGGLAIGLPVAAAAGRYAGSVLFGVRPGDPMAYVSTAGVLLAIGIAAAFWPARRSASMDPMAALRHE